MTKATLMVVEDEVLVARDIKSRLIQMGYDVIATAGKGAEAIDKAALLHPQLILMDINLRDEMDGIEAAIEIRKEYDVPIIYCTAFSDAEILNRAKISDPYGYVLKPFESRELEINIDIALYKHRAERDLKETKQRLNATLESVSDGIIAVDMTGKIFLINSVASSLTRWSKEDAIGRSLPEVLPLKSKQSECYTLDYQKECEDSKNIRLEVVQPDGTEIPIELGTNTIREDNGDTNGYVITFRDIIQQLGYELQIQHNALYDTLTNLPNRTLLVDRLVHAIHSTKRGKGGLISVLSIDLDEFRLINEGLGHHVGDKVISAVGQIISDTIRPGDTLARVSGDGFYILLDPVDSASDVFQVCNRIQSAIAEPLVVEDKVIHLTATAGIVLDEGQYQAAADLIRDADTAMHRAKSESKGSYVIFDDDMHQSVLRLIQWKDGMQQAVQQNTFEVFYQPIVSTKTEKLVSMEALIRWRHHEYGLITPSDFIPIAEKTGLIVQMGEWMLRSVCKQIKQWEMLGYHNLKVAVNLSARQFEHDIPELIRSILKECRIAASSLGLEITEGLVMQDIEQNIAKLEELRDMGLNIALDDFGTGYSSLAYLKRFPIHTLKIDRSFITDISRNPEDRAITRTIIAMAQNLDLDVVAEGVETNEQVEILRDSACDYIQGFYYSRPIPSGEVIPFIEKNLLVEETA